MAIILLTSMALLLSAFTIIGSNVSAADGPMLWTDKPDYWPNEIVLVYGSGFEPYSQIDIPVIRPDSTIVIGDGSFIPGWDSVWVNGDGMLAYEYQLDGILGLYEVRAYVSPWSGDIGEIPLTSVTFTDAPPSADIDQLKNGKASDPTSPGDWVNGNLNEQGAHYVEGYSIPYRCVMENMPTGIDIVLTIEYDIKHSDRHAIDYLTYYDRINDPLHSDVFGHAPESINPLQDVTGVSATVGQLTIPAPTSVGSPVSGQPTQSYNDLVAAEGTSAVQMTLFGGTISNIAYGPQGDLTASQSAQQLMITFELDSETAVLAWGGHIATRLDWGFDTAGDPLSAGGISGSPYHMRLIEWYSPDLPENKNLPNLGNQDRSLNAVAVYFAPPGQICVFKYEDMNLNGEYDMGDAPLVWHITIYNDTMVMVAEGDTNASGLICFDLPAGTYYVVEASDPDYIGIENGSGSVMVVLEAGGEEQVIFGNAEKGSICGEKYEDLDGSSTINAGDGKLEGWTVYLYMWDGDSYEPLDSTTTGADGSYCFDGLDPREKYAVYEENRIGWAEIIYQHEDLVFTSSGQELNHNDFLNFELIDITVCKLQDLTGDGESLDDQPLEGWTVSLWWKALSIDEWTQVGDDELTGADGCYTWNDLGPGYYEVRETVPSGWTATSATSHNFGRVISGHATYQFNFTNFHNVEIRVCKLVDSDLSGTQSSGDDAKSGWTVSLWWKAALADSWSQVGTDRLTGMDGCYTWDNLGPGYYEVRETVPSGWMAVTPTTHDFGLVTSGHATYEFVFLNAQLGCISGYKYKDVDLSGTINAGDTTVAGWVITLKVWDGDSYETVTTDTTDYTGKYEFCGLNPYKMYAVYEEMLVIWTEVIFQHEGLTFTSSGQTLSTGTDFLNALNIDICGHKYEDVGLNGWGGDVGVAGWQIDLYGYLNWDDWDSWDWAVHLTMDTGAGGAFCFTNLNPYWIYDVYEESQTGWMFVSDPYDHEGIYSSGGDITGVDFLNAQLGCISGYKYEDVDLSGTINAGDTTVAGWEVTLKMWDGDSYETAITTLTNVNGKYEFCYLNPYEEWAVYEELRGTWTEIIFEHEGLTFTSSGQTLNTGNDFLNAQNIDICVCKYEDVNLNGDNDDDAPVENWRFDIWAFNPDNIYEWGYIGKGWTGPCGCVCFQNLNPYKGYIVSEAVYLDKLEEIGDPWTPAPGWATTAVLYPGDDFQSGDNCLDETAVCVSFLNAKNASICGVKWEDYNLNHVIDDSIVWIGWGVDLYKWNGTDYEYVATTYTGTDPLGGYCFENLDPYGMYKVIEHTSPYSTPTISEHEGLEFTASGVNITGMDFLNAENIDICGYKLEDVDLDGVGDVGVEGWFIEIFGYANYEDWLSYDECFYDYNWTDEDGRYCFENLNPYWIYDVYEEERDGWTPFGSTFVWELMAEHSGEDITDVNFTNAKNASICGVKWVDYNLNEVIDDAYVFIGWPIDLYKLIDEVYVWQETAYTGWDPLGGYCFENLDPYGTYKVMEQDAFDDWTQVITMHEGLEFITSGVNITGVDFLNAENIDLCGYKLEDTDLDGEGDVGVEGWLIEIYGYEPEDWWDMDAWCFYDYTYTDENGHYCFENLNPYLIYDVYEEERSNWTAASPTFIWELMAEHSGEDITGVNFTNAKNASICGVKWEDYNLNHVIDDSIVWIGWGVDLYKWNGAVYVYVATTYTGTDPLGGYCFENLDPYGMYKVIEHTSPFSTPTISEHEGLEFTASGVNITDVDFLNAENGDICGHKYWDKNADGTYNGEDVPLSGWTVKLYKWSGTAWVFVAQDLTNETGVWCFENLNPYLTYKVEEVLQAGWVPINPETGIFEPISFSSSGETLCGYDFLNTLCGPDGKTIGFWSTNVGKNLKYIKGKAQVSKDDLSTYLTNIYNKYYVTEMYDFDFLYFPSTMNANQKLEKAWMILTVPDNSVMQDKAEAQILALLLTEQWKGADYSNAFAYIPGCITGHGAVMGTMSSIILHILDHYEAGEFTQAKNEADFLNNLPYSIYWCP